MKRRKPQNSYYLEIRYFGSSKKKINNLINEVHNKFKLKKGHKVPHITLVQPFKTSNQKRLVSDFKRLCSHVRKSNLMRFNVDGFGSFPFFVVFTKINPDDNLLRFRKTLMKQLRGYCNIEDVDREYKPHTTIALKMGFIKFSKILLYLKLKRKISFRNTVLRATLLKGDKILYEYDFILRRLLNRREAKSKTIYFKTMKRFLHKKQ